MRFAAPQFFWLLLVIVPLLVVFLWWTWRVKQRLIGKFVQSRLLSNLTVGVSPSRQKMRLGLIVAAVALLFVALARPQWGFSWEEAKQQGLDIVVAIDTSRSMLAEDVSPNRISRAKLAALDLMQLAKNDRLGLVSFAGTAFLQAPLTLDEEAFRQNVNALEVGIMPEDGTDLTSAINAALTAFEKGSDNHKVLVLITDGEDHESDAAALEAAESAAKAGMKIFTIGVGTAEGELLRARDEQGNMSFIKDENNNAVKSHLNETLLQKMAAAANGFYLPLRGPDPIKTLYATGLAPLPKSDSTTKLTRVFRERFHWPLILAIACLIAEMLLPEHKRPRTVGKAPTSSTTGKAVATLCILLTSLSAWGSPSSAMRQYESGKFADAYAEYDRLSEQKTNDYRLHYNAGTAAYKAQQYEAAEKHLKAALNSPEIVSDLAAQERTHYNLGNTQFQMGSEASPEKWSQAITNFDIALKLDPKDTNALNNLNFVKKKLEELKKQQQQQQQQQQNGQNKDQKDQKDQQQQNEQKQQQDQKNSQKDQQQGSQQKNDQQKPQPQPSPEKQKEQQQQAQGQKDKKEQNQAEAQKKEDGEKSQEQAAVPAGQLTRQQAKQLLDAQQEEEKALIFTPEKTNTVNRSRKNW